MTETIVLQLHIKICIVRSLHTHFCVRIFNKKNFVVISDIKCDSVSFQFLNNANFSLQDGADMLEGSPCVMSELFDFFFSTSSRKSVFKKSFFPSLCNPGATGVTTRVTHCSTQIAVVSERMEEIA